jgi:hypothetical protein
VVLVRFDNGAMATAEASFNAVYGYDIRGEVFGSAGMATAGDIRRTTMAYHGAELAAFTDGVHAGATLSPDGHDAAPPWPSPWPPSPRSTPASRYDSTRSSSPDQISDWRVHMGRYLTPLAVVLVVAAVVIIVTSGESIAVRYLVGLVSLDVAARLVLWERRRQNENA